MPEKELKELLEQYRYYQREAVSGVPGERAQGFEGMRSTLEQINEFPLPFCVGDRCCYDHSAHEGTVIFADDGCVVVAFDSGILYEAFNAYEAHTRLTRL